jgi:hypothetical protein
MICRYSGIIFSIVLLFMTPSAFSEEQAGTDPWQPIRFLEGEWAGTGAGMGGDAKASHTYEYVIKDNFLHLKTQSIFRSKEEGKPDDIHEDWGFFSYNSDRGKLILRQFLSEGFVNTYVLSPAEADSNTLVFHSESAENAGGMGARITYKIKGRDEYELLLDLAPPDKEFFNCRHLKMERVK